MTLNQNGSNLTSDAILKKSNEIILVQLKIACSGDYGKKRGIYLWN